MGALKNYANAEAVEDALDKGKDAYTKSQENASEILNVKSAAAINLQSIGMQYINMFNKDGEINSLPSGETVPSGTTRNTVDGTTITFNRRSSSEFISGQFINGLINRTVKITFNCISTGAATQGTFRIYKKGTTTALKVELFSAGEQTYSYSCGTDDELLFCFGGNGSAAGVQIENLMIRDNNITDDTYKDYIPSLQEQINTLAAQIAALTSTTQEVQNDTEMA